MKATDMKKGQTIVVDGKLYAIVDYQHVKLGKGGAIYQTKLKNIIDGSTQNIRVRAEENLEEAYLDKRTYEYLYSSGSEHVLMDCETYDQISLGDEIFGDAKKYIKANMQVQVSLYENNPVLIELPNTVDLEIIETPPEIKGATATHQTKPATMDTGLVVMIPPFIGVGEILRIDTRTGEYITRVKS